MVIVELRGWHLGAIGRAAALAFARVLGFATVVAALTPTIALAGVLTLASMLFFGSGLGRRSRSVLRGERGLQAGQQVRGLHRRTRACQQAGDSRAGD